MDQMSSAGGLEEARVTEQTTKNDRLFHKTKEVTDQESGVGSQTGVGPAIAEAGWAG